MAYTTGPQYQQKWNQAGHQSDRPDRNDNRRTARPRNSGGKSIDFEVATYIFNNNHA